jgi:hypothetical protein
MTDTEVVVVTPETKQKPDMTKVREAKKRKQQERDTMLSDLSKQVSVLGNTMKSELDDQEETDGPVVVTKKKQKVDENGLSLKSEVFKAVMVGALGLATWYVNSVMFVKKQEPLLDRIQAPITSITPLPVVTPLSMPHPMPPKKKIGASGLLE